MAEQKGAINMSLGFIVAVIFAVVFISVGVIWIQQFMADVNRLTVDLIKEGKATIRDTFRGTNQKFDVYPHEWELERTEELLMVAGIINKEDDSMEHTYVVNVIPTKPDTASWIDDSEFKIPLKTQFGEDQFFPITITPAGSAPAGTYVFYVIACKDKTFASCQTSQDSNHGSAQYVRIKLI